MTIDLTIDLSRLEASVYGLQRIPNEGEEAWWTPIPARELDALLKVVHASRRVLAFIDPNREFEPESRDAEAGLIAALTPFDEQGA